VHGEHFSNQRAECLPARVAEGSTFRNPSLPIRPLPWLEKTGAPVDPGPGLESILA